MSPGLVVSSVRRPGQFLSPLREYHGQTFSGAPPSQKKNDLQSYIMHLVPLHQTSSSRTLSGCQKWTVMCSAKLQFLAISSSRHPERFVSPYHSLLLCFNTATEIMTKQATI